jgi:outer membrane murein-binding lipoprotein Lpp
MAIGTRTPARNVFGINLGHVASVVIIVSAIAGGIHTILGDLHATETNINSKIDQLSRDSDVKIDRALQGNSDHEARLQSLERSAAAETAARETFERYVTDTLSNVNKSIGVLIGQNAIYQDRPAPHR